MTAKKYLDYDGLIYYEDTVQDRLDEKADSTDVPTALTDLNNDGNFVQDASYVHTDVNFTDTKDTKLAGIASGAQVNVIETVKVNGSALTPSSKAVDISVPTTVASLSDASDYAKKTDLVGGMTYKGSVQSYANLPASGQATGDMYNVATADSTHGIAAGDNVAWNGSSWDVLRGDIDLSGYVQQSDLVAITNAEIDAIVSGSNV